MGYMEINQEEQEDLTALLGHHTGVMRLSPSGASVARKGYGMCSKRQDETKGIVWWQEDFVLILNEHMNTTAGFSCINPSQVRQNIEERLAYLRREWVVIFTGDPVSGDLTKPGQFFVEQSDVIHVWGPFDKRDDADGFATLANEADFGTPGRICVAPLLSIKVDPQDGIASKIGDVS